MERYLPWLLIYFNIYKNHEVTITNNLKNNKIKANIVIFRKGSNPRKINNTNQR